MKLSKQRKGLTLIELLIVVIILGALAAIAIPRMSQSADTARTRACLTNVETINTQVELYSADNDGSWPDLSTFLDDPNYFPETPECPSDGSYAYYGSNHRVTCSVHGH